jgi:hypothetical protein
MQNNTAFADCREQKRELDLQRTALLVAISVVSKRLAGRLVRMESQALRREGGCRHDSRHGIKPCE